MFGYVTPYKMELKIKDYEKFKAYYCGLCRSIKHNLGNVPRVFLNYDMTFLAILLDSLEDGRQNYEKERCVLHPMKKKVILKDSEALEYAAFCNISLVYFKLLDDVSDDMSFSSRILSFYLKRYLNKMPEDFKKNFTYMSRKLKNLYDLEKNSKNKSIDVLAHPFGELTGFILSSFKDGEFKDKIYSLGYNLGKWIYIIDALDDLNTDMYHGKFNAIEHCFNCENLHFKEFSREVEPRIDFILGICASQCMNAFNELPVKRNEELLYNILQYGLLDKMDKVFKRGVYKDEKSI
ncbi:MAG: DUF5685 family protein [Clostridium luticellarii]|jgi:hypothetical protein|uniref:DUF5685 family protein n=1 Tax=Clostridium luticellarii TaxID=1691940 RepID=UPI002352584C|nr:DUF5685 family protein [Clostridium luticellarii]MCI1995684.1 DUF5685 family protein [Clostridium luticellarii]MCI2040236.1 DUF5685 family protein [Clostridium luticellarii]